MKVLTDDGDSTSNGIYDASIA